MATLKDFRQQYPQYDDMPDAQLADKIHAKFYPDLSKEAVYERLKVNPPSKTADALKGAGSGLAEGTIALATGLPDLGADIGGYLAKKAVGQSTLGLSPTGTASKVLGKIFDPPPQGLGAPQQPPNLTSTATKALGLNYDPQTPTGKIAKGVAEFVPGTVGSVGPAARKIAGSARNLVTEGNAPLLAIARKFNVPVFRSQLSRSQPVKMAGSLMKDIPFSGTEKKITDQVRKFNNAVMKTLGGEGEVTPRNLGKAYDRISGVYKKLTGKYNIASSPTLDDTLLDLAQKAEIKLGGSPEKLKAFDNFWDIVLNNTKNGQISGETYQYIRSGIGSALREDTGSPELGELQNVLDDHFQANMSLDEAQEFQQARKQYRRMIAVEKVLKTGEKDKGISPSRLQGAVRQVFGDYAYNGNDDLEQLAQLGTVLKDTFPQSGTGPRTAALQLARKTAQAMGLGGAGYAAGAGASLPALVAALGGGMLASKGALVPFLYQDVANSPYTKKIIEDTIKASEGAIKTDKGR